MDSLLPHQSQLISTSFPMTISSITYGPQEPPTCTPLVLATPVSSRSSPRSSTDGGSVGDFGFGLTMFGHKVRTIVCMLGRSIGLTGIFFGGVLASGSIILRVGASFRIRDNRSHWSESFLLGSLSVKKKSLGENHRYAPSRNGCLASIRCTIRKRQRHWGSRTGSAFAYVNGR